VKKRISYKLAFIVFISFCGIFILWRSNFMNKKIAIKTREPLLIQGDKQNSYSILPAGTKLYLHRLWDEGHITYYVYFNLQSDIDYEDADAEVVSPLWLRTVDRSEVEKLNIEYPISRDELVSLLKAKRVTKQDLAQLLRDWTDD
jgi:hypothetical protein